MEIQIVGPASADYYTLVRNAERLRASDWFKRALVCYWHIADKTPVDPVVLAAQCAIETGWGKFGGDVKAEYGNPCGMRNYNGDHFAEFPMHYGEYPLEGTLAHAEHLAAYAGFPCRPGTLNPRERFVRPGSKNFGIVRYVEELGGDQDGTVVWASDPLYGDKVVSAYERLTL